MEVFVAKKIEGFETVELPPEIYRYLRNRWIHLELGGPNANITSSWNGVSARAMFTHLDHSYRARQYKKTGAQMAPQVHPWRKYNGV